MNDTIVLTLQVIGFLILYFAAWYLFASKSGLFREQTIPIKLIEPKIKKSKGIVFECSTENHANDTITYEQLVKARNALHGISSPVKIQKTKNKIKAIRDKKKEIKYSISVFKDGDMWCALYGNNLQEGYSGFGKTLKEALHELSLSIKPIGNEENDHGNN